MKDGFEGGATAPYATLFEERKTFCFSSLDDLINGSGEKDDEGYRKETRELEIMYYCGDILATLPSRIFYHRMLDVIVDCMPTFYEEAVRDMAMIEKNKDGGSRWLWYVKRSSSKLLELRPGNHARTLTGYMGKEVNELFHGKKGCWLQRICLIEPSKDRFTVLERKADYDEIVSGV